MMIPRVLYLYTGFSWLWPVFKVVEFQPNSESCAVFDVFWVPVDRFGARSFSFTSGLFDFFQTSVSVSVAVLLSQSLPVHPPPPPPHLFFRPPSTSLPVSASLPVVVCLSSCLSACLLVSFPLARWSPPSPLPPPPPSLSLCVSLSSPRREPLEKPDEKWNRSK